MLLVNFAFAQTPTQTPTPTPTPPSAQRGNVVLNSQKEKEAQTSLAKCTEFRNDVAYVYNNQLKAVWYDSTARINTSASHKGCFIVAGTFDDDDKTDISTQVSFTQPAHYEQIQSTIRLGSAITSGQIIAAQAKDLEARQQAGPASTMFGWIINALLSVINALLGWLAALAGMIFVTAVDWILSSTLPNFVFVGWSIIRDIANMFFILILIVIGLAAILRIESYDYRHLLTEVVIMAILVNFSMVIATTLMDTVNVLTSIFAVGGYGEIWAFVYKYVTFDSFFTSAPNGWMAGMIQGLSKILFTFVAMAAFLALTGLFIIRLVGLYVLIIFSPLAYALDILPATKHFAHEWWEYFVKYLIWPPVALFMVQLTILVTKSPDFKPSDSAFNYIVVMAFLWGAVIVAEHAGMVGGKAVVNAAEKFAHNIGHSVGHMASGYVGRKWNEKTIHLLESHDGSPVGAGKKALFAVLNPIAAYKGAQQRSHELTHMAQEEAAAGGREVVEQAFTTQLRPWRKDFGKAKLNIPYRQFVARKDEDKFLKDYGNMKKESLMRAAVDAENMHGFEGEARKRAIVKAAAANGYLDDLMRMKPFAEKYTGSDNVVYGAESLNRFLYGYLGEGEQAKRFMAEDMEELGKKVKHFEYLGHAYYDPDTKEWKRGMDVEKDTSGNKVYEKVTRAGVTYDVEKIKPLTTDTWQVSYSSGEFGKLGGRDRVGAAPHNFTVVRAQVDANNAFKDKGSEIKDYTTFGRADGEFDTFNTEMLKKMDADVMREVQHAQARVKTWILADSFVPGTQGAIVVEDDEHVSELKRLYEIQPEFAKGLYTKVLKVKGDAREKMDGIRYVLEKDVIRDEATGKIIGAKSGSVKNDIGKPTFTYEENPPEVKK